MIRLLRFFSFSWSLGYGITFLGVIWWNDIYAEEKICDICTQTVAGLTLPHPAWLLPAMAIIFGTSAWRNAKPLWQNIKLHTNKKTIMTYEQAVQVQQAPWWNKAYYKDDPRGKAEQLIVWPLLGSILTLTLYALGIESALYALIVAISSGLIGCIWRYRLRHYQNPKEEAEYDKALTEEICRLWQENLNLDRILEEQGHTVKEWGIDQYVDKVSLEERDRWEEITKERDNLLREVALHQRDIDDYTERIRRKDQQLSHEIRWRKQKEQKLDKAQSEAAKYQRRNYHLRKAFVDCQKSSAQGVEYLPAPWILGNEDPPPQENGCIKHPPKENCQQIIERRALNMTLHNRKHYGRLKKD